MNIARYKSIIFEFLRYGIVGGLSFVVDITILYLCEEYILKNMNHSLYIATAAGFIAGIAVNYYLCFNFVFLGAQNRKIGRTYINIVLFIIIGLIGLGITELGMFIGAELFERDYLIVKAFITAIVLIWNFTARRNMIFRSKYVKYTPTVIIKQEGEAGKIG